MPILGDMQRQSLENIKNSISDFVWKGPKNSNGIQEEIKLSEATYEQLRKFYLQCEQMLYNTNSKTPGRLVLIDLITEQIQKCRAELLIRWLRAEKQYTNTKCLEDLRTIIKNNKDVLTNEVMKTFPIGDIINGLPEEYQQVPIQTVLEACLDYLGLFDTSHLTLNFIVKMGLWFTRQELQQELYRKDPQTGKARNRLDVVREELGLNDKIALKICNTGGLSYAEFRSMYKLKKDKYTNLTSEQLKLLSNKVLYRLQTQCEEQAEQWKERMNQIVKVAELKGWDVTRNVE